MNIDFSQPVNLAPAAGNPPAARDRVAEQRELIKAVHALNESKLFGQNSELTFTFDRATKRPIMRIVDRTTSEVIRQIPPEQVLRMAETLGAVDKIG